MRNSPSSAPEALVTPRRRSALFALLVCVLATSPARAEAQEAVEPAAAPAPQTEQTEAAVVGMGPGVSPGGAFLRAALLPGWGHASIGSYNRGAFYFAAEVTTAWGIMRTQRRITEARDRAAFREAVLRSRLEGLGTPEEEIDLALEEDELLQDLNDLATARRDEREDWAALGIFLVFLAGADAFVSAHLKDFPSPIILDATPTPDGRVELQVGLRLPN